MKSTESLDSAYARLKLLSAVIPVVSEKLAYMTPETIMQESVSLCDELMGYVYFETHPDFNKLDSDDNTN
jgi:hypothetical protein